MTLAGFPPTRVLDGTFLVTIDPAATTEFSPKVTSPFVSITLGFPIVTLRRFEGSRGWLAVMMLT
jgi:hypothetical protein